MALANKRRAGVGLDPLPERLTPHSLRRTFCSLLYALGETPPAVMRQMGHTDPKLALKVYEQSIETIAAFAPQHGGIHGLSSQPMVAKRAR